MKGTTHATTQVQYMYLWLGVSFVNNRRHTQFKNMYSYSLLVQYLIAVTHTPKRKMHSFATSIYMKIAKFQKQNHTYPDFILLRKNRFSLVGKSRTSL